MNRRHLHFWSLVLALTLGAYAPTTASTSLPLRYLASSDALFDTLVREAPRRHIVVNPYGGRFELIAANREAGVVSLAYDLRDLYGPARQTATFQLFDNRDGTVDVRDSGGSVDQQVDRFMRAATRHLPML